MDPTPGHGPSAGQTLGHFRLIERIGAGGMGEVWRARDGRLERDVALKLLLPGMLADEAARRRFRREALALSKLAHPSIATVFDFDTEAGLDYLVMEYVAGPAVTERLAQGPLAEAEVARLGVQLAEGLAAAHAQGIIHRDLKPGNVRLTPDGRLKILDFGLARLVRPTESRPLTESLTEPQALVGTLAYMAPEQVRGEAADARSDLWAAGLVLYELATGMRAYAEERSAQLVYAILNQTPAAPRTLNGQVSAGLEAIILKCLERESGRRYQSATELAADLQRLLGGLTVEAERLRVRVRQVRALAIGMPVAVVVVLALLTSLNVGGLRSRLLAPPAIRSIAVLPLANLSGEASQEYFADGMTDELITVLAQISALKVISRTSVMKYKGTKKTLPEIARELHVDGILEGSVTRAGDQVRISAQLIQAATERHLWGASYRRQLSGALELQDEVARAVAEQIRIELSPEQRARLTRTRTVDPEALEAYLRGRAYAGQWTPAAAPKAIESFRRAIEIAPDYAAAHAGLASTYCMMSSSMMPAREAMPRARTAALRALELDSTLALAHSVLGYVRGLYEWNWKEAEVGFRRAIALDASEAFAHQIYGYILTVNGRLDEAIAELQRAHELDPLNLGISSMQLWPYNMGRRYEQAIQAAQELLQADSTAWDAPVVLLQSYTQLGRYDEALVQARLLHELTPELHPAQLGYVYAKANRTREAWRMLAQGERLLAGQDSSRYGVLYDLAVLRAALGDRDRAIQYLQRAVALRQEDVVWVKMDPRLDPLRSDPRFRQIQRRVGFAN